MPPTSAFADLPGARLYYSLSGSGPPVVLIHGFTLDARMWDGVAPLLAARHAVLAYDVRGFGRSSLPGPEAYSHRDDLAALLDALVLGPVDLVGHSIGAHQALEFALAHPARVRSLVLHNLAGLGGVPYPPEISAAFKAVNAAARAQGVSAGKALWSKVPWVDASAAPPGARAVMQAMSDDYSGWHWLGHPHAVRHLDPPPAARLREVSCPTLVLLGERDLQYNRALAEKLAAEIPGARLQTLPGLGHMAPLEDPAAVAAALLAFLG